MRGTLHLQVLPLQTLRIIPAHAGNTAFSQDFDTPMADHPRACGEHSLSPSSSFLSSGSSPRMRGTRIGPCWALSSSRIIPAHAGNTRTGSARISAPADHPRACGEHEWTTLSWSIRTGSSPRMRGTRKSIPDSWLQARIIPAHAGNTGAPPVRSCQETDHPRACGEHCHAWVDAPHPSGSSPRMRGTLKYLFSISSYFRIIPAHAGNTVPATPRRMASTDHPRACGEHWRIPGGWHPWRGSSPRMRGTLVPGLEVVDEYRIIPAHAGNTRPQALLSQAIADHPRACGEHFHNGKQNFPFRGSSPRMRGTPGLTYPEQSQHRIIPAHAGNTCCPCA